MRKPTHFENPGRRIKWVDELKRSQNSADPDLYQDWPSWYKIFQNALKLFIEGIFRRDFFKTTSAYRDTSIAHVFMIIFDRMAHPMPIWIFRAGRQNSGTSLSAKLLYSNMRQYFPKCFEPRTSTHQGLITFEGQPLTSSELGGSLLLEWLRFISRPRYHTVPRHSNRWTIRTNIAPKTHFWFVKSSTRES